MREKPGAGDCLPQAGQLLQSRELSVKEGLLKEPFPRMPKHVGPKSSKEACRVRIYDGCYVTGEETEAQSAFGRADMTVHT